MGMDDSVGLATSPAGNRLPPEELQKLNLVFCIVWDIGLQWMLVLNFKTFPINLLFHWTKQQCESSLYPQKPRVIYLNLFIICIFVFIHRCVYHRRRLLEMHGHHMVVFHTEGLVGEY